MTQLIQSDDFQLLEHIDEKEGKNRVGNRIKRNELFKIPIREFQQPHRQRHIWSNAEWKFIPEEGLSFIVKLPPLPFVTIQMVDNLKPNNKNTSKRETLEVSFANE